ncbi:hypothetical protein EB796_006772 [Bugula neritina]|uniref:Uncharacterized protein n=1 Tax=Bugula neritina TaxID=10212 RepID=A0A7J7K9L4_BUGNE|nr:hypothetical protein EB796_006772 [Bugula neritina]
MPYNLTTTSFGETGEISDRSSRSQRVLRHQKILNKMLVAPRLTPPRAPTIATTYDVQPENGSPLVGWQTMCPLKTFIPN